MQLTFRKASYAFMTTLVLITSVGASSIPAKASVKSDGQQACEAKLEDRVTLYSYSDKYYKYVSRSFYCTYDSDKESVVETGRI